MSSIDHFPAGGSEYWRSLDELADTPEFRALLEKEFPGGVETFSNTSRRHFMKVMGASLALAGLASCRWPKENIMPFARRPAGRTPGATQQFATTYELGGVGSGLLVTSYDGRPIKVEGNPGHPQNRGATTAIEQALLLEMYDPDRSRQVRHRAAGRERAASWSEVATALEAARANGGAGLRILAEASSSESLNLTRKKLLTALPAARWCEYEPISRDQERDGARLAFGRPYRSRLALDRAAVVVALDADPLGEHPAALKHARDFATGRGVEAAHPERSHPGRLHVVEPTYTLTGGMADHRYVAAAGDIPAFAAQLTRAVIRKAEFHGLTVAMGTALDALAGRAPQAGWIDAVAADLVAYPGKGLVVVGPRQPTAVHALAHWLNAALENAGKTVDYVPEPDADRPGHTDALRALATEMSDGKVDTLVILGGNPVFDAPADLDFTAALARVKTGVHLSLHDNETSARCTWSLPRAHVFESWGDARAWDGTWSLTQPLIAPLWGGRTPSELLSMLLGENRSAYELTREAFRAVHGASGLESAWRRALHDGVVPGSAPAGEKVVADEERTAGALLRLTEIPQPAADVRFEVLFAPDPKLHDGRFANNGWLQELPEPVTKITWDNAALIAPEAAARLRVTRPGEMIRIDHGGRTCVLPAFIQPGQADRTVVVWLGQGRSRGGRVLTGVGFDTYRLRGSDAMHVAQGASVAKEGGLHRLATTQDHHAMDTRVGRRETDQRAGALVREASLEHYRKHPDFAKHGGPHVPEVALWQERKYDEGHRWGMAIDLNVCTGCSACVVACQAENNIPVVGKDEVARGREMHWIRIDRYYKGEPDAPKSMAAQPVPCMQCENAPCEQVCPVAATVHSAEGLNDMVYNRCIGTRYCSNNCPFKVRRFNWFLNHKDQTRVEEMRHNPDVTLRARGVMEKCTYCVQRINAVKIQAKNDRRTVEDGEITPACAQVCPTRAITFGDLNDAKSRVAKLHADPRCYGLLDEYKVLPRTRYLARIKNPAGGHGSGEGPGH